MTLLGCFAGVAVGAMSDKFAGKAKRWIIGSFVLVSTSQPPIKCVQKPQLIMVIMVRLKFCLGMLRSFYAR